MEISTDPNNGFEARGAHRGRKPSAIYFLVEQNPRLDKELRPLTVPKFAFAVVTV